MPDAPTEPHSSYFVCGTPRSGSWLLCGLLASTGIAGRPHEYFWRDTEKAAARAWDAADFAEYVRYVLAAGTTPNGVFGVKVMWGYSLEFLEKLRRLPGTRASGDRELLEDVFPQPRFVWLRRDDVVAQAVSWARAIQTSRWHAWDTATSAEPRFDFDQIDALAAQVTDHDAQWRRWFSQNEIRPLEIGFEALVGDTDVVVHRVLAFLGLDLPTSDPVAALTTRTGDALNAAWAARYRSLKRG